MYVEKINVHVEHWAIEDILSGYIECDSKRSSGSQYVVEPRKPFAGIIDRVHERREDALQSKEDQHGDKEHDLASDLHLLPRSGPEEAVVRINDRRKEQRCEFGEEVDRLICSPPPAEACTRMSKGAKGDDGNGPRRTLTAVQEG